MKITFSARAWKEYKGWQRREYSKTLERINDLLEDINRNGVSAGKGKPERLRWQSGGAGELMISTGWFTRRIQKESKFSPATGITHKQRNGGTYLCRHV